MSGTAEKIAIEPGFRVSPQDIDKLIIDGVEDAKESAPWSLRLVYDHRYVLTAKKAETGVAQPTSSGSISSIMYKNLLLGLIQDQWNGTLHVDTSHGVKKIFFYRGQIVFASSTVIDDRLGEILYREARISIDQLTFAASQVTKAKRFGQVLVSKGGMSNFDLWNSLVSQVQHIVRSTFMVGQVYFEMEEGGPPPATEICMSSSSRDMVLDMFAYGVGFRTFLEPLAPDSQIFPTEDAKAENKPHLAMGTFLGDFLEMIKSTPTIEQILNASKLIDIYTIAAVYQLNCLGLCKVKTSNELGPIHSAPLAPLRNKIEAYSFVLAAVKKAFLEAKVNFPQEEVRQFVRSEEKREFPYIYFNEDLNLARESIAGIYHQCQLSPERIHFYEIRLEGLIQFLFQIAGDHLKFAIAKQLRQEYRSVTG